MGHLVRIKDRNEYIRDIYDFAEGIRLHVGNEAADFLVSEYGEIQEKLDALEKEYEEVDDAHTDALSELDDVSMELSQKESDLDAAQELLVKIATHIVTHTKDHEEIDSAWIVQEICKYAGKTPDDFDASGVVPF
nr:hypothetical protein [uncultured Lachnoclostridium sp.]